MPTSLVLDLLSTHSAFTELEAEMMDKEMKKVK